MAGGKELPFGGNKPAAEEFGEVETSRSSCAVIPLASPGGQSRMDPSDRTSLKSMVQSVKLEAERNAIAAALENTGWNRKAAARLLKVSYRTLLYKIDQYQMRPSDSPLLPGGNGFKGNGNGYR
jgi:DNA-binding NtrC family response regulator